jgi:hypothetical protein
VGGNGYIAPYGSSEHEGSMLELRPGESIRVKANMKLHTWPLKPAFARFRGEFWLRRNVFHPKPGEDSPKRKIPNETPTPSIAVHLPGSTRTEKPN